MSALLGVLCVLWASSASLVPGRTVARVELVPPRALEFIVRATIPVPRDTYPRLDGLSPFSVRDVDGTLRPAQTEIVSRYPHDRHGADVVEIAARVHRPESAGLQDPVQYDVVFDPHASTPLHVGGDVNDLLRDESSIRLIARDVFDNVYVLAPLRSDLPSRVMRAGALVREHRSHGSLMPVSPHGGADATLPHFLGVHTYVRVFDREPILELDLRIHNGHSGLSTANTDDPLGTVYFKSLDLELPKGWLVRDADPDSGAGRAVRVGNHVVYPLIAPLSNGSLHVMRRQSQTTRRLVVYQNRDEGLACDYVRDANLAYARRGRNVEGEELFSWWNAATARYFPQRRRIPDLRHIPSATLRTELELRANKLSATLRTGIAPGYPILAGGLGWAHPYGVDSGGMAGGDGIVMYDGLRALEAATNAGWRALAIEHRMYTDRHPAALYNLDGEPSDYLQWTIDDWSGRWLPIWCFVTPILYAADPFGFTTAPTFQVDAVRAQHLEPAYEATLATYEPIDFEHYVRYTSTAKALVWIGNDSLAKDAIFLAAALFRMSYNELPNSQYGHYIPTGLGADENYVAAHPGIGFTFGRLESWGADSVAAAYSFADPVWRGRVRLWFGRIVDLVDRGQSQCSGIIQALKYEQLFLGQYRARQSIEQAITENMLVSVRESVMRDDDPVRMAKIDAILTKSLRAMVTYPSWSDQHHAPWQKLAVGDGDFTHPPFCDATPANGFADAGDAYQCWSSFAYAYDITHDAFFLQRASEMAGGGPLLAALKAQGLENLENRAALLALMQELP